MFSEYASKYLSKSQRPAPLFDDNRHGDSDVDDYLEAMSGSTEDGSLDSESESESLQSSSDSDVIESQSNNNTGASAGDPPSELLVERPKKPNASKHRGKRKQGYSLWKKNVEAWTRSSRAPASNRPSSSTAPPGAGRDNAARPPRPQPMHSPSGGRDVERGVTHSKPLDNAIAAIYLVSLALSLSTATIVSFSAPHNGGGNIYPIFAYSAKSLIAYAVIAAVISATWLFCIRHFTRAVVQLSVFAVPIVLCFTSFASIIMSIHHTRLGWHGLAHAAMRLSALVPLAISALWVLYLRRVKDVMGKAADIVTVSAEVYNQCTPAMTVLTVMSGVSSLIITGTWSFFLAKAFLEGGIGIVLVVWFSFMYLWTWSIFCSLLRAVLAIVTSVWYASPPLPPPAANGASSSNGGSDQPSVNQVEGVLGTSIYKAATFHFSSICLSALVAVLVRVPLLILPYRLSNYIQGLASMVLSTSATRILNPLTLPTSVIEQCSLGYAAQLVGSSMFDATDQRAYRLAKLFLVAGRLCCSLLVGFLAWIHADRVQDVSSAYGYLVAIVAWLIGWTIMGASENMLSMISDALLVNYVLNPSSPRNHELHRLFGTESLEADEPGTRPEDDYSD